jgi:hypothetical protein
MLADVPVGVGEAVLAVAFHASHDHAGGLIRVVSRGVGIASASKDNLGSQGMMT